MSKDFFVAIEVFGASINTNPVAKRIKLEVWGTNILQQLDPHVSQQLILHDLGEGLDRG